MRAPLRYFGAKWRLAPQILPLLPATKTYIEPFFGSGAILLSRPRSALEIVGDAYDEIVNWWRMVRDRPADLARAIANTPWARRELMLAEPDPGLDEIERARRLAIRCWQSERMSTDPTGWICSATKGNGGNPRSWPTVPDRIAACSDRLRGVQIDCHAWPTTIATATEDALIYCDPPYPSSTRKAKSRYAHEMSEGDHRELLAALLTSPAAVAISGYACELYDSALAGWDRTEIKAHARSTSGSAAPRIEVVWRNLRCADLAGAQQELPW